MGHLSLAGASQHSILRTQEFLPSPCPRTPSASNWSSRLWMSFVGSRLYGPTTQCLPSLPEPKLFAADVDPAMISSALLPNPLSELPGCWSPAGIGLRCLRLPIEFGPGLVSLQSPRPVEPATHSCLGLCSAHAAHLSFSHAVRQILRLRPPRTSRDEINTRNPSHSISRGSASVPR